jgi:hypothetical protein
MTIDFSYAFAPPHRLTIARPNSGDKTLLDAKPGSLRMAWTTDSVTRFPPMSFCTPAVNWEVILAPQLDGHAFARSTWTRLDGCLPILDNRYIDGRGSLRLEVAGCEAAAVARITLTNDGDRPHRFGLRCERPGGLSGYNPAWVDPAAPADVLLAGWFDRADRVIVLGLGADRCAAPQPTVLHMEWELQPGETRAAWLIRPYRAWAADLDGLRARDWQAEFESARAEWRALLDRAARPAIPDPGVRDGFYTGLADLFIMREPVGGGYIAGEPGTEVYRAPNSYEAGIMAVALDQCGLHDEAELGYRLSLDTQEPGGDWTEPHGWAHLMWGGSGFKCWAVMEHYRLTGDRDYLARLYPRMAASSRWQERQRARTRVMLARGERPLTYGLMPRGMGDGGLKDGDDLYGVFIPHNIWAVYADRCAVEAARILGRAEDLPELDRIYQAGLDDLLRAMEDGAIVEDGYRWIPGVPGKTSGSRWAVLNALFPCGLLPADHPLITGTLRKIESQLSPGGIPINTGWMPDGMWVAITLDNLAEAHLARCEGDPAAEYLAAVLNHGTPLYSWCEERGQEPGTDKISGDRQHLWTPLAVVRAVRDCLVMESGGGDGLRLALGTPRAWLGSGQPVGIAGAPTHFGRVSYELRYDAGQQRVFARATFPRQGALRWAELRVRLPGGLRVASVDPGSSAAVLPGGEGVRLESPGGEVEMVMQVAPQV